MQHEHYLLAKDTALLTDTTVKALRVYEAHGLIKPERSRNNYRHYGTNSILRIKTVRLLQQMGFRLGDITTLFEASGDDLTDMLDLQLKALEIRKQEIQAAIHYTQSARAHYAGSSSLSIKDLIKLLKEHNMTEAPKGMDGLIDKHYTKEQLAELESRMPSAEYLEAVQAKWAAIFETAKLLKGGNPTAPEAVAMARQAKSLVAEFTQGNSELSANASAVWTESMNNPDRAAQMPIDRESWDFLQSAMTALPDSK